MSLYGLEMTTENLAALLSGKVLLNATKKLFELNLIYNEANVTVIPHRNGDTTRTEFEIRLTISVITGENEATECLEKYLVVPGGLPIKFQAVDDTADFVAESAVRRLIQVLEQIGWL